MTNSLHDLNEAEGSLSMRWQLVSRSQETIQLLKAFRGDYPEAELRITAGLIFDADWFPDLVIVDHPYPEAFSSLGVLNAIETLPLARWVVILGAWSETAGRSGLPWPFSVVASSGNWRERMRREISVIQGRATPLPLTASREEIVNADWTTPATPRGHSTLRAGWLFREESLEATLRSFAEEAGIRNSPEAEFPDLVFVDVDRMGDVLLAKVGEWRERFSRAQWIAVTGEPGISQTSVAGPWSAMISKLGFRGELFEWLLANQPV